MEGWIQGKREGQDYGAQEPGTLLYTSVRRSGVGGGVPDV